jgi:hypothetical protein
MPRIALAKLPLEILQAEIQRRAIRAQKKLNKLLGQRAKLDKAIAELEAQAGLPAAAPVAPATRGGKLFKKPSLKPARTKPVKAAPVKRATGKRATGKPLGDYVAQVLNESPEGLSVKKIEAAVRKAGYPTAAKNIYNPIMKVLGKGGFKRLAAGVYAAGNTLAAPAAKVPAPKAAPKSKAKSKRRKRGQFAETAEQFILGLVTGKGRTTGEVGKAWQAVGRGGKADTTLGQLVAAGKIKRDKLGGRQGSLYTLA